MTEQIEYKLRMANANVIEDFNDELLALAAKLGDRAKNMRGFAIVLYGDTLTEDGGNVVMGLVGEPEDLESIRESMAAPIAQMAKDIDRAKEAAAPIRSLIERLKAQAAEPESTKCEAYPHCLCGLLGK